MIVTFTDFERVLAPNVEVTLLKKDGTKIASFLKVGYRGQFNDYFVVGISEIGSKCITVYVEKAFSDGNKEN